MDLHQRLRLAAETAAQFEYKSMLLPRGEPSDLIPKHYQSHLLKFWDSISDKEQTQLAEQVKTLFPVPDTTSASNNNTNNKFLGVTNIFHDSLRMSSTLPARFEAPDPQKDIIDVASLSPEERSRIENNGIEVLASGKGAVLILAGGSGTRLGVSFPKGMLVCPDTAEPRSLFQWHCERILSLQREFAIRARIDNNQQQQQQGESDKKSNSNNHHQIPVAIMLSPQNEAATKEFFITNKFFGLDPTQVYFFTQSCMPCFNPNGKIILSSKGSVAMAPGGNAGIYPAVYQSGVLKQLRDRGVELIQIVTVDNLLVSVADPILFGSAVNKSSSNAATTTTTFTDVVAKSCPKLHDNEAVGVFARRVYPGDRDIENCALRWGVVEYSEVGPELAAKKRPGSDERMFNAGNIAVHLFSAEFVERAALRMLSDFTYYHVAKKPVGTSIPLELRKDLYAGSSTNSNNDNNESDDDYLKKATWAPSTESSTPGIKLEAFIFDLFQYANSFKLLNVVRSEEFSAIKNADDSGMQAFFSRSFSTAAAGAAGSSPTGSGELTTTTNVIKKDSPQTAVLDLHALHAKWLLQFLREVVAGSNGNGNNYAQLAQLIETHSLRVEITPLAGARGDSLLQRLKQGQGEPLEKVLRVTDENLAKIREIVDDERGYRIVLLVQPNGVLQVEDMCKGMMMQSGL